MTKKEFVEKVAGKLEKVSKKDVNKYLSVFLETIEETLVAGEEISFIGFGKWEVVKRKARECKNPQTGAKIKVPAKNVVKFKIGKALKTKVEEIKPTKKKK